MKNFWLGLALLFAPLSIEAQTITLGPIAKTAYCVGDTMLVPYQASGTFLGDNVFYVEISDPTGSFVTFSTSGHSSSMSGTISVRMTVAGSKYRVRIASSNPYTISMDNGNDIQVLSSVPAIPNSIVNVYVLDLRWWNQAIGTTDYPVMLFVQDPPSGTGYEYHWNLDQDAVPNKIDSFEAHVKYASAGKKSGTLTVSAASGCDSTAAFKFDILSCFPAIPPTARVVTKVESGTDPILWIKAGGSYTPNPTGYFIAYVEPGGSLIYEAGGGGGLCYLRPGGSFSGSGFQIVKDSDQILPSDRGLIYACKDLQFDYSQVASVIDEQPRSIAITQNSDHLKISAEEQNITTRLFSLLGTELLSQFAAANTGTLDIDLSPLPAGMYFAVIEAGGQREVRKIVVSH